MRRARSCATCDASDAGGRDSRSARARTPWRVIEAKPADKPGSVTARGKSARYDRHSSRPAVADGLEPPTRGLGEQRRRPPIWRCSGWRLPRFTRFANEATRLCGPVPRLRGGREADATAAGRYPASCSAEPGLSSPLEDSRAATIWRASNRASTRSRHVRNGCATLPRTRLDDGSSRRPAGDAPAHLLARTQRDDAPVAEGKRRRHAPRLAHELDRPVVRR